jgi:hypothetical protein
LAVVVAELTQVATELMADQVAAVLVQAQVQLQMLDKERKDKDSQADKVDMLPVIMCVAAAAVALAKKVGQVVWTITRGKAQLAAAEKLVQYLVLYSFTVGEVLVQHPTRQHL